MTHHGSPARQEPMASTFAASSWQVGMYLLTGSSQQAGTYLLTGTSRHNIIFITGRFGT
ncbi:hypothetical protein PCANC_02366 [Puccinia coronata f. sp. avenae]|uniref:Uncharacterized protein n=1 Tax=Puccinia coronata f. sp. avenae TaxID=200324 RepID=A0A2N5SH26_9BASI|nr:hypothetical protein PCANC_23011 [Puccinia coronata f. sp. avenae]PLW55376.1 hypothetical protein PCANC_02366 [Puccinia coronata f. sp. avenae]